MSLADALAKGSPIYRGTPCWYEALSLEPADKAALDKALASEMQHTELARILKAEGHDVKPGAVARHRQRGCQCH